MSDIVGEIRPGEDGPAFTILHREHSIPKEGMENVRPCEHTAFILDEKFSTVTCGKCKTHVDPFAAMMLFAEWYQRLEHKRHSAECAERDLYRGLLRQMGKRKALTDPERAEITAMLRKYHTASLAELKELERKIGTVLSNRRWERRKA